MSNSRENVGVFLGCLGVVMFGEHCLRRDWR
jgi:hypothetical protein